MRIILCQISNTAIKTTIQFKGKYKGLLIRKGHKRALLAVGYKILRVIHSLQKNNNPYKDPEIDYEEIITNRHASHWMRSLQKFGFLPPAGIATERKILKLQR